MAKNIFKGLLRLIIPGISFLGFYMYYNELNYKYIRAIDMVKPIINTQILICVGFMVVSVLFAVLFLSLPGYEKKDNK